MRQETFAFLKAVAWAEPPEPGSVYRYALFRSIDDEDWHARRDRYGILRRTVCFVMLNPSKASAEETDPTIDKLVKFSRLWGFERLAVVNLFAYRETDSKKLRSIAGERDIIGPHNDQSIHRLALESQRVVCAWGKQGDILGRDADVKERLRRLAPLWCFRKNLDGSPVHPLYQRDDAELVEF